MRATPVIIFVMAAPAAWWAVWHVHWVTILGHFVDWVLFS